MKTFPTIAEINSASYDQLNEWARTLPFEEAEKASEIESHVFQRLLNHIEDRLLEIENKLSR